MQREWEAAFFYNKTANLPESIFKPLAGASVEFDAIYNAKLAPWKRHELSLGIERCAFLFYRDRTEPDAPERTRLSSASHTAEARGHVFINPIDADGFSMRLEPIEVNRHLNRAAVGLCLSKTEGAMFASTEYLLAGLPVVTTPSHGGRDVYLRRRILSDGPTRSAIGCGSRHCIEGQGNTRGPMCVRAHFSESSAIGLGSSS